MAKLVLVRHGQSEWNKKNLFTGWKDVDLTETGINEAKDAGKALEKEKIDFNQAFTSELKRAQETCQYILNELGQENLSTIRNVALNERDYGDLAGMNKDDARKKWGEEQVHIWRRSFDTPPPGGESLKDTAERVIPYFLGTIMPLVLQQKNILVAAHGNSLRALVMHLEQLKPEEIISREIATGVPIIYEINNNGKFIGKKVLEKDL